MTSDNYDASSIKILSEEDQKRFLFVLVPSLVEEYKKPSDWIERGLMACSLANEPFDYFIDKYLKKLPIEENYDITQIHSELQREAYNK